MAPRASPKLFHFQFVIGRTVITGVSCSGDGGYEIREIDSYRIILSARANTPRMVVALIYWLFSK